MAKYTIELDALLRTGYDIGLKRLPYPQVSLMKHGEGI